MTASSAASRRDRFHVTTTTGGAPRVLAHMEDYLQTEFTDLKVWLTSTTEQWAVIAVQGPQRPRGHRAAGRGHRHLARGDAAHERARGQDLRRADAAVPRQLHRRARLRDQRARRLRPAVWEAVWARGPEARRSRAYGTEAMHVLRAEKGYIIVGQETDGTVTPDDLGLDWAIGKTKTGLRRQALACPAGHARSPTASSLSAC